MQPDISVTGITLPENQHAYATQKAKQDQRQQHLAFHLCDYRHQRGNFDRIVSLGIFNMSACVILTAILPRLRGYWHQMEWH
jgi:cyclopropane-fatty-acyl-phospholipid synthase